MHASKTLKLMADMAGKPVEELEEVVKTYPFSLTPFLRKRVENNTYSQEALKQFLPDIQELQEVKGFSSDPVGESEQHPTSAVVQVYPNRLVIILSYQCLVYCRFCFRKALVGKPEYMIKEEGFSVISWAKKCGIMKRESSSLTCSTFEEKSPHSCLPFYCQSFPVFA